jgi:hypothetical protein
MRWNIQTKAGDVLMFSKAPSGLYVIGYAEQSGSFAIGSDFRWEFENPRPARFKAIELAKARQTFAYELFDDDPTHTQTLFRPDD